MSPSLLLIADLDRHCVEKYTFSADALQPYMGSCGSSGNIWFGHRLTNVRMTSVFGLHYDSNADNLYVTAGSTILLLSVSTGITTEFIGLSNNIRQLTYDSVTNSLIGVFLSGIYQIPLDNPEFSSILAGTDALVDCSFSTPRGVMVYKPGVYLVPDLTNSRLAILQTLFLSHLVKIFI